MMIDEAKGMMQAKLTCMELSDKACFSSEEGCNRDCDGCEYMYGQGTWKEHKEALEMAIKALEKQVPKKPTRTKDKETEIIFYFCPNCKKTIGTDIVKYQSNNCSYCGQQLDWEGEQL